jgi:hypothetical protein
MKRGNFGISLVLLFVAVLAGYVLVYNWMQHRRVAKGPWVVTFASDTNGASLTLRQTALGVRDIHIVFTNAPIATNFSETLEFATPRGIPFDVPFGECVFFDARFLPGTVVLNTFGHEIQMLPRVLTIDDVERPWTSGETIALRAGPAKSSRLPRSSY